MSGQYCYIVSLKHTLRDNQYITVWRPNNCGYCWALSWAGRYGRDNVMQRLGYYNSGCGAIAVPCATLDALGVAPVSGLIDGNAGPVVPNTRASWRAIMAAVIAPPEYPSHPQFKGAPRIKVAA